MDHVVIANASQVVGTQSPPGDCRGRGQESVGPSGKTQEGADLTGGQRGHYTLSAEGGAFLSLWPDCWPRNLKKEKLRLR